MGTQLSKKQIKSTNYLMKQDIESTEITFGNEAQEDARLLQELREENNFTSTDPKGEGQSSAKTSSIMGLSREQSKGMNKLVLESLAVTPTVGQQASFYEKNSENLPLVQEMEAAATSVDGYPSIQIPNLQDIAEQDERSVYVGNVDYSCDALDLVNFFKDKVSKIFRVTIVTNKFTGSPMGFAYIELGSVDDVMSAMELNNCTLKDRKLNIKPKRTNFPGFQKTKKNFMSLKGELARSINEVDGKRMFGSEFLKMIENRAKALNKEKRSSRTARPGSFNVGSFSQKNTKSFRFK